MRIQGLDTMRAVAVFSVVVLHVFPMACHVEYLQIIVMQPTRFAVPFFFVASGFFYSQSIHKGLTPDEVFRKTASRILWVYPVWAGLYFINPPVQAILTKGIAASYGDRMTELYAKGIKKLIFVGPEYHLWFFVSLLLAVVTFHIISGHKRKYLVFSIAVSLYTVGVLGGSYSATSTGIDIPMNTRNFIFFSMLPFTVGYYLYGTEGKWKSFEFGLVLWLVGTIIHFLETRVLYEIDPSEPRVYYDYVFSTLFMGIGAFIVGRSDVGFLKSRFIAGIGKLSLGIYASHLLFAGRLNLFKPLFPDHIWMVAAPMITFAGAAVFSYLLSKITLLRRFVM